MSIVRPFIAIPQSLDEWDRFFRDATVGDNEITDRKLRDSSGNSVIGRSASTAGDPSDITATGDNQLLITRAGVLGFNALVASDIPAEIKRKYTTLGITSSTAVSSNTAVLADATAGAITVTLPAGTANDSIHVKKTDSSSNPVTIAGSIDGYSSIVINLQYQSYHLIRDGSQWWII